jgi:hypothetical protein
VVDDGVDDEVDTRVLVLLFTALVCDERVGVAALDVAVVRLLLAVVAERV